MRRSAVFKSLLTAVPFVVYAALSVDAANQRAAARCAEKEGVCANENLAAFDAELGRLFALARQGSDLSSPQIQALLEGQREWVRDRNECWKARDEERCVLEQYAKRIHQLRRAFVDARSDDWAGISAGPLEVSCDTLGPTASLTYVRGDPEVAYLELAHTRVMLTDSATGAERRYVARTDEGEYALSPHGSSAILERPGAADDRCQILDDGTATELAQVDQPT